MSPYSHAGLWPAARSATNPADAGAAVTEDRVWLSLPAGRLVAADPIALSEGNLPLPFAQTVPPGRYPVDLLIERGYVAAARLVIRAERATAWEPAALTGRLPAEDHSGSAGYAVESGIGCFTDEEALRRLCAEGSSEWQQNLMLEVTDRPAAVTMLAHSDRDEEAVLVAFRTGRGECVTWAGRNAHGDITCFVTDFFGPDLLEPKGR